MNPLHFRNQNKKLSRYAMLRNLACSTRNNKSLFQSTVNVRIIIWYLPMNVYQNHFSIWRIPEPHKNLAALAGQSCQFRQIDNFDGFVRLRFLFYQKMVLVNVDQWPILHFISSLQRTLALDSSGLDCSCWENRQTSTWVMCSIIWKKSSHPTEYNSDRLV